MRLHPGGVAAAADQHQAPTLPSLYRTAMEEVVIAGMSGKLPESDNMQEFWTNLIGGIDMVTDDDRRWKAGEWVAPALPSHTGQTGSSLSPRPAAEPLDTKARLGTESQAWAWPG